MTLMRDLCRALLLELEVDMEKLSLIGVDGRRRVTEVPNITYQQDHWKGSTCSTCCHYCRIVQAGVAVAGQCRRFPPTPIMVPGAVAGTAQVQGVHPPVREDWVCGEWTPGHDG